MNLDKTNWIIFYISGISDQQQTVYVLQKVEENENTGDTPVAFIQPTGRKDTTVDAVAQPSEYSLSPSNKQFQKAAEDSLKREKKITSEWYFFMKIVLKNANNVWSEGTSFDRSVQYLYEINKGSYLRIWFPLVSKPLW